MPWDPNYPLCATTKTLPILVFIIIVYGFSWLINFFTPPFSTPHLVTLPAIIITAIASNERLGHAKNRQDASEVSENKLEGCRKNMMVGYGGIMLCSFVPRLAILFLDIKSYTYIYILIASFIICIQIYSHFLFGCGLIIKELKWNQAIIQSFLTNLALSMLAFFIFSECDLTQNLLLFVSETSCFLIGVCSYLDFSAAFNRTFDVKTTPEHVLEERFKMERSAENFEAENFDDENALSCLDAFMYSYAVLTIFLVVLAVFFAIFERNVHFLTLLAVSIAVVVIFGGLEQVSLHLERNYPKDVRTKLLLGFGGISVSGIVPRVLVMLVPSNYDILIFTTLTSLCSALSFYYLFARGHRKIWNLNYGKVRHYTDSFFLVQLLISMIMVRIAMEFMKEKEYNIILFHHVGFFFMTLFSSINLMVVLKNGVELENEEMGEQEPKKFPRPSCKSCSMEYSETRIPRILKDCGHTLCEVCIGDDKLPCNTLICPSCNKSNHIAVPAKLPKNFTILDYLQDIDHVS
ncbi:unnamed protein product [Caenorhabditis brenneri]